MHPPVSATASALHAQRSQRFSAAETPPLTRAQAVLEAERCLYCHAAPCTAACPTGIDVPSFIRRIADGNLRGAARAILEANPLGGVCARVCPTETLCEGVCVRKVQSGQPVAIGQLQRYAVDALMASSHPQIFTRSASTGRHVAVVGAGPAGLACAHVLARHGHTVTIYDAKPKGGGLNEFGLAAYKVPGGFAQAELQWLLDLGGIQLVCDHPITSAEQLGALRQRHDAVFLAVGLGASRRLGIPGEDLPGVREAIAFIAELRQAQDLSLLDPGRHVVVIGGGMTAVDAAVQSKLLGAETVTMVYRRGPEHLSASNKEIEWAKKHGVVIRFWWSPVAIEADASGQIVGVRFRRHAEAIGPEAPTADELELPADRVLKAIGQVGHSGWLAEAGLTLRDGRIVTGPDGQTGVDGVWAGGDCRAGGRDLTVEAVEHGKRAAAAIHHYLQTIEAVVG